MDESQVEDKFQVGWLAGWTCVGRESKSRMARGVGAGLSGRELLWRAATRWGPLGSNLTG